MVIKKSFLASLPIGTTVFKFSFSAGNDTYMYIEVTDSTPTGGNGPGLGGGGGGGGGSDVKPENGILTLSPAYSPNTANTEITYKNYKDTLDTAVEENGVRNITININDANVNNYITQLTSSAFGSTAKPSNITINTAIAGVTLPSDIFSEADLKGADHIGINISAVDKSKLPDSAASIIGDAPVVDISITVNGTVKAWSNPDTAVKVSIPYALKEGESGDNVTIFYIDSKGKLVNMRGIYDPSTGKVTFTTTHFSKYAVKVNRIQFNDMKGYESYQKYIESMAAKGIIDGVGNNQYAPGKVLTRAEFAKLLVTMLELAPDDSKSPFTDVKATDWFTPYINAAFKAGLIKGIGGNRFAPSDTISTQDAALILIRALQCKGVTVTGGSVTAIKDSKDISSYAVDAVGFTVSKGITPLDPEGELKPKESVTRASAAQYIYNVFYYKN